jgi:protein phosphatase PTC6
LVEPWLTSRHGGKDVSTFLQTNLHNLIETASPSKISSLVDYTITLGGYFKRFRGGALHRWTKWAHALPPEEGTGLTLEERLTLAFLMVSRT